MRPYKTALRPCNMALQHLLVAGLFYFAFGSLVLECGVLDKFVGLVYNLGRLIRYRPKKIVHS